MCRSHKQSKQQQKEEEAKGGERKAKEGEEYRQKWREMGSLGKREHPVSPSPSPPLRLLLLLLTCDAAATPAAANCCSHLPLIRSRIFQ